MVVAFQFLGEGKDGGSDVAVARHLPAQPVHLPALRDRQRLGTPAGQLLLVDDKELDLLGEHLDDSFHRGVIEGAGLGLEQEPMLFLSALELAVDHVGAGVLL